jgi:hypothetical protein
MREEDPHLQAASGETDIDGAPRVAGGRLHHGDFACERYGNRAIIVRDNTLMDLVLRRFMRRHVSPP